MLFHYETVLVDVAAWSTYPNPDVTILITPAATLHIDECLVRVAVPFPPPVVFGAPALVVGWLAAILYATGPVGIQFVGHLKNMIAQVAKVCNLTVKDAEVWLAQVGDHAQVEVVR